MSRLFVVLLAGAMLGGCASITSDSTQLVRVDALDEQGVAVPDAKCDLTNDKGTYATDAGKHAMVGKSGKNLNIRCSSETRSDAAEGTSVSRAGAGMFGNILFGGGIGAIIDHNRGTAYNYPEWVQVVFGQVLVFDRNDHKDGVPMEGKSPADVASSQQEQLSSGDAQ